MQSAVLRFVVLLPFLAFAQEGCGELEARVKQLQQENAELYQQAAGHEQAKLEALQALQGLQQQAGALQQQAVASEAAKNEALQAVEHLKQQIGGHEAAKAEALEAVEGLKSEVAGHAQAKEAVLKEVEDLKKQAAHQEEVAKNLTATCAAGDEMPYLSTDVFSKVLDILVDVTSAGFDSIKETYPDWDAQLASVAWTITNSSMEQAQVLSAQVAELSTQLAAQAYDAADKAKAAATDLHKTHVEPHLGEHLSTAQKEGMELFATHVEPRLGTARTVYKESVHPHVDSASTVLLGSVATLTEQAKMVSGMVSEATKGGLTGTLSAWAATSGHLKALQDMDLLSPKSLQIGSRVLKFPRGVLDISAAAVQLLFVAFIFFIVAWRLCLKTLLWRLGVKVFGLRAVNVAKFMLRLCKRAVSMAVGLSLNLMLWALGLMNMVTCLSLLSAVGCCLVYGIELSVLLGLGVTKGLSLPVRLAAGLAIGLLCGLVLGFGTLCGCCGICWRKKRVAAKADKAKKAETNGAKAKAKAKAPAANGSNGDKPKK